MNAGEERDEENDYTPGNPPVPLDSIVKYYGSLTPGLYRVLARHDPADRPADPRMTPELLAAAYPDGVAYDLWPADMPVKFGLRDYAVYRARRGSFTVISLPTGETAPDTHR